MTDIASLYSSHLTDLLSRHRHLMRENEVDYLLVPSGEPVRVYLDDMDYPFKSSFLFRTYVPLTDLPHSYLLIGLEGKPTLVYYQPVDYWHTPPADPDGIWPSEFSVEIISEEKQAFGFLPPNTDRVAVLGEPTQVTRHLSNARQNPEALLNAIYWQRAYKSDYEIECLQRANNQAAHCHRVAEQMFRSGKSEQQIHLAYVEASGMLEHQMPYSNIVALNEHSAILHYTECEGAAPTTMNSFLIDAGVSYNGYHSDITRTYSFATGEFADLIDAMDEMQLATIAGIQTGQSYLDLHLEAQSKDC